ncbi:unnamed protein product [Dibothriocephalus latus]|uniref:Uncharacterized protein n=1 Tax=Dibothriocephalus latus TaxID=60516 RepID=A0A3P6TX05_DIBLA|nr:unnamed protein product [Dibothriocephalus latus]
MDFQARQHLQEICSIADSEEHATQRVRTVQESSLCQSLDQKSSSSYHIAPLGILSTMVTEQLKLPICAFLPISSAAEVYLGKQINKSSQKAKNKTEQYAPLTSQRDQQQLHLLLFKHSTFAAFVTGIYRLCLTTILLGVCVCWLLACKYLIAQMCSRTVSVLTNRVSPFVLGDDALCSSEYWLHPSKLSA